MHSFNIYISVTKELAAEIATILGWSIIWCWIASFLFGVVTAPFVMPLGIAAVSCWGVALTCEIAELIARKVYRARKLQKMQNRKTATVTA